MTWRKAVATVLDLPLQAACWLICPHPFNRAVCPYDFITGSPGNPLRHLLWWITDHSAFWRDVSQEPGTMRCPECGGPPTNGHDREDPPNVYLCPTCDREST